MSSQVLGSGTDRNGGLVDFETDFGPLCDGVEADAPLDEHLRQIFTLRLERVGSDGHGTSSLLSLNELKALTWREKIEEQLQQVVIVVESLANVVLKLVHIVGTRFSFFAEFLKVRQDFDCLLDAHLDDSKVFFR